MPVSCAEYGCWGIARAAGGVQKWGTCWAGREEAVFG